MKNFLRLFPFIILVVMVLFISACDRSSDEVPVSPDSNNTQGIDNPDDEPMVVLYDGFDFNLTQGDYWTYSWSDVSKSTSRDGTSTSAEGGTFTIWVGGSELIDGHFLYKLEMSGDIYPGLERRLTHIGTSKNKLLGYDGSALFVLFDATTGYWPGHALFTGDFDGSLVEVSTTVPDDTLEIEGSAYTITASSRQDKCEYYPGVGSICGDDSYSTSAYEYYQPNLGVVGYYSSISASYSGGGFSTYVTITKKVVLEYSSLRGDDVVIEREPNDTPQTAQVLSYPTNLLFGSIADDATGSVLPVIPQSEQEPNNDPVAAQVLTLPMDKVIHASVSFEDESSLVELLNGSTTTYLTMEDSYKTYFTDAYPVEIYVSADDIVSSSDSVEAILAKESETYPGKYEFIESKRFEDSGLSFWLYPNQYEADDFFIFMNVYAAGVSINDYNITAYKWGRNVDEAYDYKHNTLDIEDYYKVTLTEAQTVTVRLTSPDTYKEMSVYLFGADGVTLKEYAFGQGDITTELILEKSWSLEAGTYYFGLDCHDDYHNSKKYKMSIK